MSETVSHPELYGSMGAYRSPGLLMVVAGDSGSPAVAGVGTDDAWASDMVVKSRVDFFFLLTVQIMALYCTCALLHGRQSTS